MIKGGPRVVTDGLVLCLDAHDAKSYAGEPVTNLYGDMSTSTALRPNRTEYNTGGTWPSDMPMCPEPVGRVYKHTSGALTSSWSGNSYGYTLKDIATTSGETYICTCWVFVSADCDIDYMYLGIEGYSSGAGIPSGYTQVYNLNNKGTWQQLALYVIADTNVRFLPVYPRHSGVTDGSFSGFYAWGGAQVVEAKNYITPFVLSSRSATNGWVDRSGNSNSGTLTNMIGTGVTHYRDGQVIMPVANSYLDFDGSNDYVVVTNGMNSLVGTSATTFAAWIYIDTVTSSWDGIIANKVNATEGIALLVSNTQKIFFQYDSTSGNYAIDGGSNIPTAEWTYVVATYDTSYGYKTYMNGSLNAQETDTGKSIASSGDMTFNIGAQRSSSGNPSAYFPGKIARVEVYNKALTAAEVLSNYNATKGRFS